MSPKPSVPRKLFLTCFSREKALSTRLRVTGMQLWGQALYHKTNKEALSVLCSVVKHLGSGDSTQEVGRNTHLRAHVPPYTSFVLSLLPACFTTKQSTVEASLFVN